PVVCLEAMAARKPIVASRVGGLAEIVEDGVSGLLCEPGDASDLARALSVALENRALIDDVVRNAARLVRAYDWSRVGERYRNLIRSAVGDDAHSITTTERSDNDDAHSVATTERSDNNVPGLFELPGHPLFRPLGPRT